MDLADYYTDGSAQNYLSGAKHLSSTFSNKVLNAISSGPLMAFLEDEVPRPIRDALIKGLSEHGVQATPDNLGEVVCGLLTELFVSRVTARSHKDIEVIKRARERVASAVALRKLSKRIPALVTASRGQCVYPQCTRTLAEKPEDHDAVSVATPLRIDPHLDDYSDTNVVVLCPTHAKLHEQTPTEKATKGIREALEQIASESSVEQQTGQISLGHELRVLIDFIEKVSTKTDGKYDPNFDAVELREKISSTYRQLLNHARLLMATYYAQVEGLYRAHLAGGAANWRKHAFALNARFRACEAENMDQQAIFNHLVDSLAKGAGVSRQTAEIAVCYFIQKCEVFDEIA